MVQQGCRRGGRFTPAVTDAGRYTAVAFLAVLTAACATLTPDSPNDEKVKIVTQRAEARWKAIIGKDFASAYEYLSPKSRATVTPAGFGAIAARLAYKSAELKDVTCEAVTCKVTFLITYDAKLMKDVHSLLEESWVIDGGQAWMVWPL